MVGMKQNRNWLGIINLTDAEIIVMKELSIWPYHMKQSNYFNIAQKTGLSESHVSRCLRKLNGRGMVTKSIGGSWHLSVEIQRRVREAYNGKDQEKQEILEKEDKPLTVDEMDQLLKDQLMLSKETTKKLEKGEENKKKRQRISNANQRYKKSKDAHRYYEARKRAKWNKKE